MKREFIEGKGYYEILENGKTVYFKNTNIGYSCEYTYDKQGNVLTYKNSDGYSREYTRDKLGNILTYKNSNGDSLKWTYDNLGNELTYTENGILIIDNRPKKVTIELTQEQLDKIKDSGLL